MGKYYRYVEFNISKGGGLEAVGRLNEMDRAILESGNAFYIYKGENDMYVGQTKNFFTRHKQHCSESKERYSGQPNYMYIDGTYNRVIVAFSASLITQESLDDIERKFITYITADNENTGTTVNNHTEGNTSVCYANQDIVTGDFIIPYWKDLYDLGYVNNCGLEDVKRSILFKYSPFFSLSAEQQQVIDRIIEADSDSIVYGLAGTGKTVLITNLAIQFLHKKPGAEIAIVAQTNWVESGRKIFRSYGAEEITVDTAFGIYKSGKKFDYILVDESHRLRRYYSKTNHLRDDIFGLKNDEKNGIKVPKYDEMQYLLEVSDKIVLFYDPLQSVKPTDIQPDEYQKNIEKNNLRKFYLTKEFRVNINDKDKRFDGNDYVNGILAALQLEDKQFNKQLFRDYLDNGDDAYFGIVNSIEELFSYLDTMEIYKSNTINRVLAGYTHEWISNGRDNKDKYDWVEGDNKWQWNSTNNNWINRKNSRNEIGCIHSIQGVDLNYAGVIISTDLGLDENGRLCGCEENYKDRNGKFSRTDFNQEAFTEYIKNIYYVLLTRGISGIRVYFENKEVERYFKNFMEIRDI